jgi:signal transduction histidine kinase
MQYPIPANEMERVHTLADFNLDLSTFNNDFGGLARLAAKIAGTDMSHVNLIDAFMQWTISFYGLEGDLKPREESVCQYTIAGNGNHFEVVDMSVDDRFKEREYVADEPFLKYYYGVPLRYEDYNLGSLCVLDKNEHHITPEKAEMLSAIAEEIVHRLAMYKHMEEQNAEMREAREVQKKIVHDVRGPLSGILGISSMLVEQGEDNSMEEVLEFAGMIQQSSQSLIQLADEIMENENRRNTSMGAGETNIATLREKLEMLYAPQARVKNLLFTVKAVGSLIDMPFASKRLMQVVGNLLSNAIKFTPRFGTVNVVLEIQVTDKGKQLVIEVTDTGAGLTQEQLTTINNGGPLQTEPGTAGEKGFGFGLTLVRHMVNDMGGTLSVTCLAQGGSSFVVSLPVGKKK